MSDSNYCAHCGAKVPESSSFCPQCGGPIEGVKLDKGPIGEPKDVSQEEKVDLPTLKAVDEPDVTQPSYSDFEDTGKKQEIDVFDTINKGISIYLSNFSGIYIPFLITSIIAFVFTVGFNAISSSPGVSIILALSLSILGLIMEGIFNSLAGGMVVYLAAESYYGRQLNTSASFERAKEKIFPLIIGSITYGIAVSIGLVLLIIPGIYIMTMYALWQPVVILEQDGGYGLSKSAKLTEKNRWEIFVIMIIIGLIVSVLPGFIIGAFIPGSSIVSIFLRLIINSMLAPTAICVSTVIYLKLKR
ncbi:MAG: zinc ribbon domain-containing protein [Candidatus Ranarchaeia archaeon]